MSVSNELLAERVANLEQEFKKIKSLLSRIDAKENEATHTTPRSTFTVCDFTGGQHAYGMYIISDYAPVNCSDRMPPGISPFLYCPGLLVTDFLPCPALPKIIT